MKAPNRRRLHMIGVAGGALFLLGALLTLPFLPWLTSFVAAEEPVFRQQLPENERGAFLVARPGILPLYPWPMPTTHLPPEVPALQAEDFQRLIIIQKQLDPAGNYLLFELNRDRHIEWQTARRPQAMELLLEPGPLPRGDYMLVVPATGMYGEATYHYFQLR